MRTTTTQPRTLALIIAALVLTIGALIAPQAGIARPGSAVPAQVPLTITVPKFIIIGTGNPEGSVVNYLPDIQVSDSGAKLSCDPDTGAFARGGHKVTCTATRGDETATASFYLLVSFNDDTDVSADEIKQIPENPIRPASMVFYNVEVRNNGTLTARQPLLTGTVPEGIELLLSPSDICKQGAGRALTCTLPPLGAGKANIVPLTAQVQPGFLGSFQLRLTAGLGDGQRDLEESLNTLTRTTAVVDLGFGENAVFIPLVR